MMCPLVDADIYCRRACKALGVNYSSFVVTIITVPHAYGIVYIHSV